MAALAAPYVTEPGRTEIARLSSGSGAVRPGPTPVVVGGEGGRQGGVQPVHTDRLGEAERLEVITEVLLHAGHRKDDASPGQLPA